MSTTKKTWIIGRKIAHHTCNKLPWAIGSSSPFSLSISDKLRVHLGLFNSVAMQRTISMVQDDDKLYFLRFKKVGALYHNLRWLRSLRCFLLMTTRRSVSTKGLRRVSSASTIAGRPWAMAEMTRLALRWHGTSRRHLQETDEPNQAFLLFWNGGSTSRKCQLPSP